jgi:hypothetical protein
MNAQLRLVLMAAATAMCALGQQTTIPPADHDPFVGEWKANANKSRPKLSKTEAGYLRTVTRDGDDPVFASSGSALKDATRESRIRCDGQVHSHPSGSDISCFYTAADRVEGETRDPRQTHTFWTREVSPDGREMTITEFKDKAHTKPRTLWVLDRIK